MGEDVGPNALFQKTPVIGRGLPVSLLPSQSGAWGDSAHHLQGTPYLFPPHSLSLASK